MAVSDGPWVDEWLSVARLSTYLRQAGGDRARALALYEWTANINSALLHDFGHLEIGIRNRYDRALMRTLRPGDRHWTDPRTATALFPAQQGADARTHRDLETARAKAGGASAPCGKLLAELTFGFWTLMTSARHEQLIWTPSLSGVYPAGSRRPEVHRGLDDLRRARNRVTHHEPIDKHRVHPLTRQIRRYAKYVAPELADYITATSQVEGLLRTRP